MDAVSSDIWTQFIEVGTDGTVWFAGIALLMADGELVLDENGRPEEGDSFLMRFDGNEWQRWGPADGLPPLGYVSGVTLIPTPDGGLWLAMRPLDVGIGSRMLEAPPCSEHPGVARFDRTEWHHFLACHCVMDLVVAPDGSVWLRAASDDRDGPQQIYVITPEAVAVTE